MISIVLCVICLILFMCVPHVRVWGHTGGRVLGMISIVVFFPTEICCEGTKRRRLLMANTDIQSLSSDRDFLNSMELVVKEFLLL